MRIFIEPGSYRSHNIGDWAMFEVAVARLRSRWPEASLGSHSLDPDAIRRLDPTIVSLDPSGSRSLGAVRALRFAPLMRATGRVALRVKRRDPRLLDRLARPSVVDSTTLRLLASEALIERAVSTGQSNLFEQAVDSVVDDLRDPAVAPWALGMWTDRPWFQSTVSLVFGSLGDKVPQDFIDDRTKLRGARFDIAAMTAAIPQMRDQFRANADWIEAQLGDGRNFLLGEFSLADINAYMNVWYTRQSLPEIADILKHLPLISGWEKRIQAFAKSGQSFVGGLGDRAQRSRRRQGARATGL